VLVAGCLGRPQPHGHASGDDDANSGDGVSPDADPCEWQGPVRITIPGVPASDALTGPWLDNTRSDLWYTQLPNGTQPGVIGHALFVSGAWSSTLLLDTPPTSYANPFFDETHNSVWVDEVPMGGTRHLDEYQLPSGPLMQHMEAINLKAPSLTPDGATLYASTALSYVVENVVNAGMVQYSHTLTDPVSGSFDAPSVTNDGTALYVTRDGVPNNIYIATIAPAHTGYTDNHLVGTFQQPDKNYFDPDISRDGTTLVFASDFEGGRSRIYYVIRPAGCPP
jgi:Tol biopolymer transport system component